MATISEPGRQAAFVILDAVIAFENDGEDTINEAAMNAALRALDATGAVTATLNDDSGEDVLTVDASDLVGGSVVTMKWLVARLAEARGVDEETVIFEARQFLDA